MTKCARCGFLSLRDITDRSLVEAESDYRERLHRPPLGPNRGYEDVPLCFVQEVNFRAIAKDLPTKERHEALLTAVTAEHKQPCPGFCEWKQGFTPKEHAEMKLLEEQRAYQRVESQQQREWQAAESKKADERHRDSMNVAIDAGKSNWVSQVAVGILGAIVALAAVWIGALLNKPPQIIVQPSPVVTSQPTAQPTDSIDR